MAVVVLKEVMTVLFKEKKDTQGLIKNWVTCSERS